MSTILDRKVKFFGRDVPLPLIGVGGVILSVLVITRFTKQGANYAVPDEESSAVGPSEVTFVKRLEDFYSSVRKSQQAQEESQTLFRKDVSASADALRKETQQKIKETSDTLTQQYQQEVLKLRGINPSAKIQAVENEQAKQNKYLRLLLAYAKQNFQFLPVPPTEKANITNIYNKSVQELGVTPQL